ncbi:MAG: acyl-CoA dehydratase activase [Myxococcota bacterium]|nr:acyl-CoA dehydratase activase [Myxococcota bacterium]
MKSSFLGIDIGATNVKVALLVEGAVAKAHVLSHEGNVTAALDTLIERCASDGSITSIPAVVTGTEGRHRIALPDVIAPVAVEMGLKARDISAQAVVSMGGEDLVVYALNSQRQIAQIYSGNKCASGTGEFFRQQLGRMDLTFADLDKMPADAKWHSLSARCSVFMKSDCTHRLNKGEATPWDIALSMCAAMADKVSDFLIKARISKGSVVLIGGVTQNRFILKALKAAWPEVTFIVPPEAPFFDAFGAAHLAADMGAPIPPRANLFKRSKADSFSRFPPLADLDANVCYVPSQREAYDPEGEYILGVDGGSTTTKVALVNATSLAIVADHYGRTHGKPIEALKTCIDQVLDKLPVGAKPRITLAATTGSSRELLGVFLETAGIYNEIIAHTVGTHYFNPKIDTIFEIGGQDAKYVSLSAGVPIDYAMNEACSAGTGSFLEESARGDLNIPDPADIGPIALNATAPLKFGEHCSAFINSDIRKAIQQGASRENIAAGIVFSIVSNYLNRVVGNRMIGDHIALQGGVAKNPAVPLAFSRVTGKSISVPPDPELMGCFGVALLALKKYSEGRLEKGVFSLNEIRSKQIQTQGSFNCSACDNRCEIRKLAVAGHRYPFGGRCSKFAISQRRRKEKNPNPTDYTQTRTQMLLTDFTPDDKDFKARTDRVVGVPKAFSFHSLWPLYKWFFHTLGVPTLVSETLAPAGIAKLESNYCFPAEIAHGAIQDVIDKGVHYVFLPHFRDMPSMEPSVEHGTVCPLTQGLPFFARRAFDLEDGQILKPLVSFKNGWGDAKPAFEAMAEQLGFSAYEGGAAYELGIEKLRGFFRAYRRLGEEVLAQIAADPDNVYVAILGRPYNAFTRDANMGIPRKFTSRGVTVVPFDMIFHPDADIFPNMYWYYGQQNMKTVQEILKTQNLYLCWVTNFSCAPDSFMLHYVRWMMGGKPYLVLEIDSHTADAGVDTRVEAFLDVVDSFRRVGRHPEQRSWTRRFSFVPKKEFADIVDSKTGERIDIRDPRVTFVIPSLGDLSTEIFAAAAKRSGVHAAFLPVPDLHSTQLAREVASGKECIPSLLVLGTILAFIRQAPAVESNNLFLIPIPSTTGPCRTGQYRVFYERLFEEHGYENAVFFSSEADNSYRELGPTFNRLAWWALVLGDYFTDVRVGIRLLARDVPSAMALFDRTWQNVVHGMETGQEALEAALEQAGRDLCAIPRKRALEEVKKILIVGEIFVRRDTYSIQEINDHLIERGIYPKVTDITEWIRYTDFNRKTAMAHPNRNGQSPLASRVQLLKDKTIFQVEKFYKDMVEHKVARHLMPTGLVVRAPHDMNAIMKNAAADFIDPALESETTISTGVAATAMQDGFSGVVIIAPFACLPGRLIEGVFAPWAKARSYPVLTLENDGHPYPPSTLARMEIFAHNVLRFSGER